MLVPKLKFKEFTDEWYQELLSNISNDIQYGMNSAATDYDGTNKYIRITDINDSNSLFNQNDLVSPLGNLDNKFLVKENDILFARTGASTGKSYLYDPNDGKLYFAGFLIRANINNKYNSRFIFEQFKLKKYNDWVKLMSMRSGQPGINANEYGSYKLVITGKQEQDKIADFINLLNKKILLQEQKIEALKLYKSHMINTFFGSRKGKIIFLGDIGTFLRGFSYNKNDVSKTGLLILRSNNISDNKINYDNLQFVTKKCNNELILKNNDIVICMANGSKNLVGKSAPYLKGKDNIIATVGAFCSIFRSDKKYSKYLFQTARYTKNIENMFEGTNINNLKNSNLEKLDFYIDDSNSSYYCELLEKLDSKYNLEILKYKKILDLKKGLMQDMFV